MIFFWVFNRLFKRWFWHSTWFRQNEPLKTFSVTCTRTNICTMEVPKAGQEQNYIGIQILYHC